MRQLRKHFPAVWAAPLTLMYTFVEVTGPSRRDGDILRGLQRLCSHFPSQHPPSNRQHIPGLGEQVTEVRQREHG